MTSFFKPARVIDPKYKYWLAENKGCVCRLVGREFCGGQISANPPHHLPRTDGTRRSSDNKQIPCCFTLHRFYHDHPEEERKDMSILEELAGKYWEEYQEWKRKNTSRSK